VKHIIIDGNSIAHWRFWATQQHQVDGKEVGMLLSVMEWINAFLLHENADHVTVCIDSPRNWRYDLLPAYKGKRVEKHPALATQLAVLPEWIGRLYPVSMVDGFEADDLIALAVEQGEPSWSRTIVSRDKDMRQLVDDATNVRAFDPVARIYYDEAEVFRKHEVPAYRLREWLAVAGDNADNVKGAPSWGEDTAAKAIAETIDFEHLLEQARKLELKTVTTNKQKTLREFEQQVRLNYEIVGFRTPEGAGHGLR